MCIPDVHPKTYIQFHKNYFFKSRIAFFSLYFTHFFIKTRTLYNYIITTKTEINTKEAKAMTIDKESLESLFVRERYGLFSGHGLA